MLNISKKGQINQLASALVDGKKYKTVADLEGKLQLSRRSVFYWLKQLNVVLQGMGLDEVQRLSQGGYFLTQPTLNELTKYVQQEVRPQFTAEMRQQAIIWGLIQQDPRMSLTNLAERFGMSKNTVIKDFKKLAEGLPNDTELVNTSHGKVLVGSEVAQRRWVYQQLAEQNSLITPIVQQLPYIQDVTEQLAQLQAKTGNYYSGDAAQTLIWYIAWLLDRLKNKGKYLRETSNFPMDQESQWSQALLAKYVQVTSAEIGNLRELILAGQLQHVNDSTEFVERLRTITQKVARRFSSVSGIDMVTDNFLEALATHLYSTYYRIKYNVQYHSPSLNDVKMEYSYLMNLTKYALKPFEKFINAPVSSDELALIAVYFGGEVKRLSPEWLAAEKQPDVLLVCTSGIGTSLLLFQQLAARYPGIRFSQPISLVEFERYDIQSHHPKLILTTTHIQNQPPVPTMSVQAVPTKSDLQRLDRQFRQLNLLDNSKETRLVHAILDIITDYARVDDFDGLTTSLQDFFDRTPDSAATSRPSLLELLPEDNLQISQRALDWEGAVQRTFVPLLQSGSVQAEYPQRIIDISKQKGPYMVVKNGVMLAHATPNDGVSALSMSLLVLRKPTTLKVHGEERELRLIFGLAPVDRDSHVHALSQLLELLQDDDLYHQLLTAKDTGEIYQILEQTANFHG